MIDFKDAGIKPLSGLEIELHNDWRRLEQLCAACRKSR